MDLRQIRIFEEEYLEALPSRQNASLHSRRPSIEQFVFPQRVLDLRWIYTFEEEYLQALSSRQSASPHSRKPSIEQLIFPQRVLGYKTHLLEIYTLFAALTPYFFYLCYSLKPTVRGEWLGYISEGWRNFWQGIDQKSKAVWRERFFGVNLRTLERLFAQYRSKAEGCLVSTFFRSISPETGGAFRGASTKSQRLSGAALFRVIAAARWRDFPKRIDQKPEAVLSCTFSGHRSGLLERFSEKD